MPAMREDDQTPGLPTLDYLSLNTRPPPADHVELIRQVNRTVALFGGSLSIGIGLFLIIAALNGQFPPLSIFCAGLLILLGVFMVVFRHCDETKTQ